MDRVGRVLLFGQVLYWAIATMVFTGAAIDALLQSRWGDAAGTAIIAVIFGVAVWMWWTWFRQECEAV